MIADGHLSAPSVTNGRRTPKRARYVPIELVNEAKPSESSLGHQFDWSAIEIQLESKSETVVKTHKNEK